MAIVLNVAYKLSLQMLSIKKCILSMKIVSARMRIFLTFGMSCAVLWFAAARALKMFDLSILVCAGLSTPTFHVLLNLVWFS